MNNVQKIKEWIASIERQVAHIEKNRAYFNQGAVFARHKGNTKTVDEIIQNYKKELEKAKDLLLAEELEAKKTTYNVFYRRKYEHFDFTDSGNEIVKALSLEDAIASVEGGYAATVYKEKGLKAMKDAIARISEHW